MWSARQRPPACSVRQDGEGTGQEHGDGEEPPSEAHVFPCHPHHPRSAEAFHQSFPLSHPYPFPPAHRMLERPPSHPRVAWEEDGALQESSSPPETYEVSTVQPLQLGE